jgi:hypothetical protein
MTRAQRSHDDALGKTTTPFSDSPARRSAAQLSFVFYFDLRFEIKKRNAPPFLVKRSLVLGF